MIVIPELDHVKQKALIDEVVEALVYPNIGKPMRITVQREEIPEPSDAGDRFEKYRKGDMKITIEVNIKMGRPEDES